MRTRLVRAALSIVALLAAGRGVAQAAPHSDVRRFEWVVVVRVTSELPDAIGRAELAAGHAGGAVLESLRMDSNGHLADHRLLVRTISHEAIDKVVREIRATPGVMGATASPLPETPTWPGSPGFMESYTGGDEPHVSNAGRVLVQHDVPPIADKRELLEAADVVAGPGLPELDSLGGFTFNVSEMLRRVKASAWRHREEKLRATPIIILEPDGGTLAAADKRP